MILTVSPNAALDRVHVVRGYQPGQQCRAIQSFLQPGGSGVHASLAIQALGGSSIALGLLAGRTGELWEAEARRRGLNADMVHVSGETRESFCLIDLDLGNVIESVEKGPAVGPECLSRLLALLEQYLPKAELLVISGSLPPGFPQSGYAEMIKLAQHYQVPTIADLHGEQLRLILGERPWLIKPSLGEFEELVGHKTSGLEERADLSQRLHRDAGAIVALSMGADGLLLTGAEGQWRLRPPVADVRLPEGEGRNAIGCGDALVGALAYGFCQTGNVTEAARLGVAAAHYNLGTFGVPEIDAEGVRRLAASVDVQTYRPA